MINKGYKTLLFVLLATSLFLPACTAQMSTNGMHKIVLTLPEEATIPAGNAIEAANIILKTMAIKNVTIDLIAKNIAFNTSTITVPAGAYVTIHFDNQDTYIPHNFAVYTNASATTMIFQGKQITGPAKTTYTFTAPDKAGIYYFRCDVHPAAMNGQFIVR
jgi:plastocyanin